MLRRAGANENYTITVGIIRQLALTGCRRSEIISLRWDDVDTENSCLRLSESKEGASTRPIGLPAVEFLEKHRLMRTGTFVFPGSAEDNAFGSFQNHWAKIFAASPLADVTAHILRHSFASVANDLGFSESTIAALIGHATGSVTSKYIHTLDTALIMAADTISGYIQGLLERVAFKQTAYALDRDSRKAALARFLQQAAGEDHATADRKPHFAV
jgi:integrase